MINRNSMSKEQALYAIKNGEFPGDVISSKSRVVVIMTQDWCPQWLDMKRWVYETETDLEIDIYELLYNKTDYFNEFMNFKETKWRNNNVPYLRYYRDGKLFKEGNYVRMDGFKRALED